MSMDQRLTRAKDFAAVKRDGRAWSDKYLVIVARQNDLEANRVGFSVAGRVGNAVVRNKIKRRLKEAVRLTPVQEGWDLVIIARKDSSSADFRGLSSSVTSLLGRAGILATLPQQAYSSPKAK